MTTVLTLAPWSFGGTDVMNRALRGYAIRPGNTAIKVPYTASIEANSIPNGVEMLDDLLHKVLRDNPGNVDVLGWSQGAQVEGEWLLKYAAMPSAPDPKRVRLIAIGNPTRKASHAPWISTLTGKLFPDDTQYRVLDIGRQWDGWANWSYNPRSLIGMFTDHTMYFDVDIDNLKPIKQWAIGNTMYVNVP